MPDPIIAAEGLAYRYRRGAADRPALDGLSFTVQRGEIVGLLGPNGAGKTTAVRILTTILRPHAGRAVVAGHDVAERPLAARRAIAAVLQESAVETMLPVHDNLLLYGYLHGLSREESRRRAEAVIERFELSAALKDRAQSLSGGFKRRLQVAKAMMLDTPVLFLDEATTGMDPIAKRRSVALIREQAARGRTVLLTTHLLDEAETLCDRLVLMDRGRALAGGKLSELRALARKRFEIRIAFAGEASGAVEALRELGPRALEERDGEVVLVVEGAEDDWIRKMARISERWPPSHLEIRGVNLERIFLEIYGAREEGP
jgi:ABC-2 type transport system ATP-binding protein